MYNTSIRVSEEVRVKLEKYRIKKEGKKKWLEN